MERRAKRAENYEESASEVLVGIAEVSDIRGAIVSKLKVLDAGNRSSSNNFQSSSPFFSPYPNPFSAPNTRTTWTFLAPRATKKTKPPPRHP